MSTKPVEAWLRGPVTGVGPLLQPAAHALLQVLEEIVPVVADLTTEQLWMRPGGAAAIGFHLRHITGSLDRLLTYSRGEQLSSAQLTFLASERTVHEDQPSLDSLTAHLSREIDAAIQYLREVPEATLLLAREVGRQKLPSNTLGLIFHAAEHSARHAGQIVTLCRVVSGRSKSLQAIEDPG